MQQESSIDDIQEEYQAVRPIKFGLYRFEELEDKLHPDSFEHNVGDFELESLQGARPGLIEDAGEGFAREGIELN